MSSEKISVGTGQHSGNAVDFSRARKTDEKAEKEKCEDRGEGSSGESRSEKGV